MRSDGTPTVLLVEGRREERQAVRDLLAGEDLHVLEAASQDQALNLAHTGADLVIVLSSSEDPRLVASTVRALISSRAAERETGQQLVLEREARRHAELLMRNAGRLAAATRPREVAEAAVAEVETLGIGAVKVILKREGSWALLASTASSDRAPRGLQPIALESDQTAAEAMRRLEPVMREAGAGSPSVVTFADGSSLPVTGTMAWPLRSGGGSVLGALSIRVTARQLPNEPGRALLGALAEQTGLALGRVLEGERRRQVELELAERHRLLSELTALVPGIIYVIDLPARRTVFVNREVAGELGYTSAEAAGGPEELIPQLVHPEDQEPLRAHLRALEALSPGASSQLEYRLRHRNGSWRWFESRDSVLRRDGEGRVLDVIGVATDITDHKESEQALRVLAEQHRFRAVLADALRDLEDAAEAQRVAAELLGRHLGASRVHYAEVVEDGAFGVVRADYCDGVPSVIGRHEFDRYGSAVMNEFRGGRTVTVNDVEHDERLTLPEREATFALGIGAYVIVPLMRHGRPVAVLAVHQARKRDWTEDEIGVVEETADRTKSTLERADALRAVAESEARYRSLFSSIDEGYCLCEILTDESGAAVDYRFLEVNERFAEQTGLVDAAGRTARELLPTLEPEWVQTMARVALGGERLRYENQVEELGRWFDIYAAPVEPDGSGRFVVVINDVSDRKRAEETLRSNAEASRRARIRSELVATVMSELEAIDQMQPLASRLVETLVPRLADYALLEVPTRTEPVLALAHRDPALAPVLRALRDDAEHPLRGPTSVAQAADGDPRLIAEITPEHLRALADGNDAAVPLLDQLAPRSHIAVPIDLSGERGALLVGVSDPERDRFQPEDLALLLEITRRVSILFDHARIREDERAMGVRLQQALLPAALPQHPAVQIAARYQTGSDLQFVGGDWYDTIILGDGRIAIVVGDVVGHGLDAAAAMSRLRIALDALAPLADGPGDLLSRLAGFAAGANGVEFATVVCGFLDTATGRLTYASAGHPPMLLMSREHGAQWLEDGRSMPLGAVAFAEERPQAETQLEPGDLLILYSDGLVERRREPITVGLDRLQGATERLIHNPVGSVCDELLADMTSPDRNDDDAVIMCLRFENDHS